MKSNNGHTVPGFASKACTENPMLVFDSLPKCLRDKLNYAVAEWSVEYFADWAKFLGPSATSAMIKKCDKDWVDAAYRERGL